MYEWHVNNYLGIVSAFKMVLVFDTTFTHFLSICVALGHDLSTRNLHASQTTAK